MAVARSKVSRIEWRAPPRITFLDYKPALVTLHRLHPDLGEPTRLSVILRSGTNRDGAARLDQDGGGWEIRLA